MSKETLLKWKATIKPNTKKNEKWVHFENGDVTITKTGPSPEKIKVEGNKVSESMSAEVVVCQYDEYGSPITDNIKTFNITQDKTCFNSIDLRQSDYKLDTCASKFVNGNTEVSSLEVSGVTISANKFPMNCTESEREVTRDIESSLGCDGRYVSVTVKQQQNVTAYTSNYNTTATTMTNITFPSDGATKNVTALASRSVGYENCSCPSSSVVTRVTFKWVVPKNTQGQEIRIEKTFTKNVNGLETEFTFYAKQEGPDCGGWSDSYMYKCDELPVSTRRLLSVYENGTCVYANAMLCEDRIPTWLSGETTYEFPYKQLYQNTDCSTEFVLSEENGVISGNIIPSSDVYNIKDMVETNGGFYDEFEFNVNRGGLNFQEIYFTIRALSDVCKITFTKKNQFKLEYSTTFGNSWNEYSGQISINKGYTALFKASVGDLENNDGLGRFNVDGNFSVEGNIMSLLYGDAFMNVTDINYEGKNHKYAFRELFVDQRNNLIYAKDLVLPATSLSEGCYLGLFRHCNKLIEGPLSLPATDLPKTCYHLMYQETKKMKILPSFNGVNFGEDSCKEMFEGCGVEVIPSDFMDSATGTVATGAVWSMFNACSELTKAMDKLPFTSTANRSNAFMFQTCRKLTESPILMANKIESYAYYNMFNGCSSLKKITALFTELTTSTAIRLWTNDVPSGGTLYKHPNSTITDYSLPSNWAIENYTGTIN